MTQEAALVKALEEAHEWCLSALASEGSRGLYKKLQSQRKIIETALLPYEQAKWQARKSEPRAEAPVGEAGDCPRAVCEAHRSSAKGLLVKRHTCIPCLMDESEKIALEESAPRACCEETRKRCAEMVREESAEHEPDTEASDALLRLVRSIGGGR